MPEPMQMDQAPVDSSTIMPMGGEMTPPTDSPQDIEQSIRDSLNELDGDDRELVAMYMTPELAHIMRIFFGEAFGNVFDQLADPNKILLPVDRGDDSLSGGGESDVNTSVTQPTNSEATPTTTGTP